MIPEILFNDVLAMVAHDLRNPLTCIEGYAINLQTLSLTEAEKADSLNRIVSCSRWAAVLVNDLLDAVAIERGRFTLRRRAVALESVLKETIEAFSLACRTRHVRLTLDISHESFLVMADPIRVRQVLHNFLNNALKHVPPQGHIAVSAHHTGGQAVVEVTDNGTGIAPEDQAQVFDKFFRKDDPSSGSLGLGLYIARSIIEGHGGSIGVRSEGLGKGSTFHFSLPAFKPERTYAEFKKSKAADTPIPWRLPSPLLSDLGLANGGLPS